MIEKFSEYEDYILKCLEFKKELIDNSKKKAEENNSILYELAKREDRLSNEEKELKNEIKTLTNDIQLWKSNQMNQNGDLLLLIRELHTTLCGRDALSKNKGKFKIIQEVADESIEALKQIEIKINEQLSILTVHENDSVNFYQIVNQRKNYNKELKQTDAKLNLLNLQYAKRRKAEDKFKRIVIVTRKTEPPYYRFKQNSKQKRMLNTVQTQKIDDEDLLNYN